MKNDIREMILENMFDMAVNNQEICRVGRKERHNHEK
nr:MAG TPA: hypothetical protein [Caudoviricetes sp.]